MEEYNSIIKIDVWKVLLRPKGKLVVTSRWFYKIENATNGSIEKYKACFVAWGLSQAEGVNYEDTFVPISRHTSIRVVISIVVEIGWRIR